MARGHGRILASIWEDSDFLTLDEREQRPYLFLISQQLRKNARTLRAYFGGRCREGGQEMATFGGAAVKVAKRWPRFGVSVPPKSRKR
ncbi:hypothetical protein ACFC09_36265 [Streptomyces sp. NPDC056161]|uniref:hypothetical protein n=1 Tax=Streptomyces sp. NPDC056161 TaxID=3345732 RepID=UPI0035DFC6F4